MNTISIITREPAWPELASRRKDIIYIQNSHMDIATLRDATVMGNPSVQMKIDLPDGKILIFETTLNAIGNAIDGIRSFHMAGPV